MREMLKPIQDKHQTIEGVKEQIKDVTSAEAVAYQTLNQLGSRARMYQLLGEKTLEQYAQEKNITTNQHKKELLIQMLEDDLPPQLMNAISSMAPTAVSWLWKKLANSSVGKNIRRRLGFGDADLNDDNSVVLGNRFAMDKSLGRLT